MTIGRALQTTITQSNALTDLLGDKAAKMTEGENQATIQLGILLELRAIRLVLQAKE